MAKKKREVDLGATGGTASHIALNLAESGYDVVAAGRRKSDNGFFGDYGIQYISVDISKPDDFGKLPQEDVYAVVHYAGIQPAFVDHENPQEYIDIIVSGTLNVLEYIRKVGAQRIVFPQSLYDVHYLFGTRTPIPADSPKKIPEGDHAIYVIAKNMACDLIEWYHNLYGIKRYIFRMSRIYLYNPDPYFYDHGKRFLYSDRFMIYKAMKGEDLEMWGDPDQLLETMCIKDLEQLIRLALSTDCEGGLYNVGSGGTTLRERLQGIIDEFSPADRKSKLIPCPDKPNGTQFVLDYSKARNELGYKPEYTWRKYLRYFKEEMRLQRFEKLRGRESDYVDMSSLPGLAEIGLVAAKMTR